VDARRRKLLEWYAMHGIVNLVIAGLTLPAALEPVRREACAPAPRSTFPIELTVWLHVYHGLFFELSRADVWHHGVFLGLLGVPGMIFDWGSCGDAQLFFLCGLPGAIIYAMAIFKHVLDWRHEKKLTFAITALVRAPGALRAQYQLFLGRDLVRRKLLGESYVNDDPRPRDQKKKWFVKTAESEVTTVRHARHHTSNYTTRDSTTHVTHLIDP
jgi:hypothetical protein